MAVNCHAPVAFLEKAVDEVWGQRLEEGRGGIAKP